MEGCTNNKRYVFGWIGFTILLIAYFFVYFQRVSVSVLGIDMTSEIGGSIALLSSTYFTVYLIMQIPSGIMADRLGPRMASGIFLAIAAVGTLLSGFATTFTDAIIGKALIACGMAVVYIPLIKIIAVWFPKTDFAVLTGTVIAVGNVGAIAAGAPLSMLNDAIGWRNVFLVMGVITAILSMVCLLFIRNRPSDVHPEAPKEPPMPTLKALRITVLSGRRFWAPALAYMLMYGVIITYQGTWAISYYRSVYSFVFDVAWFVTAIGIGKMIGAIIVGRYISSRNGSTKRTMIVGNLLFLLIWLPLCLTAGEIDSYVFWLAVNFLLGLFGGFMTVSFTQVKECFPISMSGTVTAAMNTFLFAGGSVMSTISYFIIQSKLPEEFRMMWIVMAACVIGAIVLCAISREHDGGNYARPTEQ